jgi:hypothetical protein
MRSMVEGAGPSAEPVCRKAAAAPKQAAAVGPRAYLAFGIALMMTTAAAIGGSSVSVTSIRAS